MTTMTRNKLTDSRIAVILARAEICDDSVLTDYSDIAAAMRELQERRRIDAVNAVVPRMVTITRERLEWLSAITGRDDIEDVDGGEIRELARMALAFEERADKISLDYDTLVDKANGIAEQRNALVTRNSEMATLLISMKKARPGGVYFNKWEAQIDTVLQGAGKYL